MTGFQSQDAFAAAARAYLDFFKSSRPAGFGGEVLLSGEPERRTGAERLTNRVPLPNETWEALAVTARQAGLDLRAYLGA